jgi:hypothetical protein
MRRGGEMVRRLILPLFACIVFLVINRGIGCAGMTAVYIDSKPIDVEYIVVLDEVFIPAETLVEKLKENITWDPSTLWIKIGNKEIPLKGLESNGVVYLPLKALVREIGYVTEWDPEKGVFNVDTTRKVESPQAATVTTSIRKRKSVIITLFQEIPITNVLEQISALRIFADVKNEKARTVENVEAHCIFRYPEGTVFFDDTVKIERLEPGESRRVVFYTENPLPEGKLNYELKVEVKKRSENK